MSEQDPQRRAAHYRLEGLEGLERLERLDRGEPEDDVGTSRPAPDVPRPGSMAARGAFADELVRQAMARGEFDDLPLTASRSPG